MGGTLSHQAWWHNLPRSQPYCLAGWEWGWLHRLSLLVYPAPGDPLPAATSIITLEECGTLVLNSLWPPRWRRSGGGRSPRGGMQPVGAGWVLCVSYACVVVQGDPLDLHPQSRNQPPCLQTPNTVNKICMVCLQCKLVSKDLNFT